MGKAEHRMEKSESRKVGKSESLEVAGQKSARNGVSMNVTELQMRNSNHESQVSTRILEGRGRARKRPWSWPVRLQSSHHGRVGGGG